MPLTRNISLWSGSTGSPEYRKALLKEQQSGGRSSTA
jgi:hypothetical protein